MRIIIDIPEEFEEDFKRDKFEDALDRLCMDAHLVAGNYEQETATMLIKAFSESIPMYRIVEQLEEDKTCRCRLEGYIPKWKAIEIVKGGGKV